MQIVSMICHQDKAPTNALIAQSVRSCAERGIPFLWYANMTYGKKQDDGLADFKRHNGFQKIELPRYYVPLTVAGRMALRLGLHHGMSDWIPEPVAATYRRIRKGGTETKISQSLSDPAAILRTLQPTRLTAHDRRSLKTDLDGRHIHVTSTLVSLRYGNR